jgi:uncharacterized protein YerC
MRRSDIERVRAEMDRLRERLDVLQMLHGKQETYGSIQGNPESGAVRRASMDLTRALARLRGN